MSAENNVEGVSNREAQKLLLIGVIVISITYMAVTSWIPDLLYYWRNSRNKKQILRHVQTEGVKKVAEQLQKMENERQEPVDQSEIVEKKEPRFVLRRRTSKAGSNSENQASASSANSSSNENETEPATKPEVKRVLRSLRPVERYAPPPIIYKTPEEIALERSRKLKRQQDLAYQRSVEEDEKKSKIELVKVEARNAKKERIEVIRAVSNKKRAFAEGEKTVRLSFRYGAARTGTNKTPNKIKNGDILESTVTLKNVMDVFSSTDTVEYLLDYVEAQDQIMNLRPKPASAAASVDNDNFFELSLSYPMRIINRSVNPSTTLQDLNIENDSVVWITFV